MRTEGRARRGRNYSEGGKSSELRKGTDEERRKG
jgi:hypothetical protein